MPWPTLTDHIAAICRFQLVGNPEKTFSNTFYFRNDAVSFGLGCAAIRTALDAFYTDDHGNGVTIANLLSVALHTSMEVTCYDLGESPPRVPSPQDPITISPSSSALPHEVAICLSYRGGAPVTARKRGRIYIGPLGSNSNIIDTGPSSSGSPRQGPQVSSIAVNTLVGAALDLRDTTEDIAWVQLSRVGAGATHEITGGFVDRDFDTQRRRSEPGRGKVDWGS